MAYIVVWTTGSSEADRRDFYSVHETFARALKEYDVRVAEDDLYCAAITQVVGATEPHWMEVR
jgi:hypothetical protein